MSVNKVNSDGSLLRVAGGTLYADAPIGTISPFGGSTIPNGYLLCNGQAVSRTIYAELFAVIGDTFGTGDGSTTFNIPDLRETVPVGIGENGTQTIENHDTYTLGEFKDDQLKDHYHGVKTSGSSDNYTLNTSSPNVNTSGVKGWGNPWGTQFNPATTTHGKQLGVNYIIKAAQVAVPFDVAEFMRPVVYRITSDSNSVTIPNLNEYAEIEIILYLSGRATEFNGVHRLYNGITAFRHDSDASSYTGSVNWNTGVIEVASNFNVKEVICYKASQLNIVEI